ncbi:MAG TPA: DNA (cytosine-5-)-methyltransferase [Ruminococcaceae bacterium]|nr:DNA (cytosine-5-)-methyltransferase [Oscillospiraceae bacterium]
MNNPTVVSLFSGIGGIDLAFEQAGFKVVWANEIDKFACITYRHNIANNALEEADIKSIDENSVPQADVLVAGFPCQSFSVMGYQRGFNDARGNLFFEIVRIAKSVRPKVIFLENVRNLINHDNGRTFITIFNHISELGYYVKYAVQSPHTHANIPQERNRTFVVAFSDLDMMNRFSFPDEIPLTNDLEGVFDRSIKRHENYYYKPGNKYYDLLNKRIPDTTGMYRIDDSGVATRKYTISPTLKANMGTYHDRVPVIRDDFGIRKITPFECLALQGFPPDFGFKDIPIEQAYKQCGNTVCVPVVRRMAERVLNAF